MPTTDHFFFFSSGLRNGPNGLLPRLKSLCSLPPGFAFSSLSSFCEVVPRH